MRKILNSTIGKENSKNYNTMSNPSKQILLEIHRLPKDNFWEGLKPFLGQIDFSELDSEDYNRHLNLDIDSAKWLDREEQLGNIDVNAELKGYLTDMLSVRIFESIKIDDYTSKAPLLYKYHVIHQGAYKAVVERYIGENKESVYDQKILGVPLMLEGYKWPMNTNSEGKKYPMAFYAQFFDPKKPLQTEFIQIFVSDLSDIENDHMGEQVVHIRKIPLLDILCKKPIEIKLKDENSNLYILNGKEVKLPKCNFDVHEEMKLNATMLQMNGRYPKNIPGKIIRWNLVYTCAVEDCEDIPEEITENCEDYNFYMQNDTSTQLSIGGVNNSCQGQVYKEAYYNCIYNYFYADGGSLSISEKGEVFGDSC